MLRAALLLIALAIVFPAGATAEQASQPSSPVAGQLDAGGQHTCALIAGDVRCWGLGSSGQLGYGNPDTIGDDEAPGSVGRVDLGTDIGGRTLTATAISAGDFHTCALLDNGSVRCWGFAGASVLTPAGDGRLGYANNRNIGDDETPGSVPPVDLGVGQTATAISAGAAHTCAILNTGGVLCWGFGDDGRLGYGDRLNVGDDEAPGSVVPVNLGPDRTARAITAGARHTCALLDNARVLCWGTPVVSGSFGGDGRLGRGDGRTIGDDETPGSEPPVKLGADATALSAGDFHTCAVLLGGDVRCWGNGVDGRLGYGNEMNVGDNETPDTVGPVDLGDGSRATAISAGNHTCARLDDDRVRCWGPGASGRLGYGNTNDIGDNETPGSVEPVDLGVGQTAAAISAGGAHTCARLADTSIRCWGEGSFGRLGYANTNDIGDDETPAAAGPVPFKTRASIDDRKVGEGNSGERTVTFTVSLSSASREAASVAFATANGSARDPADYTARSGPLTFAPGETSKTISVRVKGDTLDEPDERFSVNLSNPVNLGIADPAGTGTIVDDDAPRPPAYPLDPPDPDADAAALAAQAARLRGLRTCFSNAGRHARRELRRARRLKGSRRTRALRHARRHKSRSRRACLKRFGRTPGRVTGLEARSISARKLVLRFLAAGTDGSRPPAANSYLVKFSTRPIRDAREFRRADSLCGGRCRFPDVGRVGGGIALMVTELRPRTTYYFSIAARDNVSGRPGPRSMSLKTRTR